MLWRRALIFLTVSLAATQSTLARRSTERPDQTSH